MTIYKKRGFTLVELLVVIAIIGILIGMLLPAVQQVREAARRTQCLNTLRQLSLACLNFESSRMEFPAGDQIPRNLFGGETARGSNWFIQILPFVEQQNVLSQVNYDFNNADTLTRAGGIYDLDQDGNETVDGIDLAPAAVTHCPSIGSPDWARDYFGVQGGQDREFGNFIGRGFVHGDGILGVCRGRSMGQIIDGTSNTMVIGENAVKQWRGQQEGGPLGLEIANPEPGFAAWWFGGGSGAQQASVADAKRRPANPARHVLTTNLPINAPEFLEDGSQYNRRGNLNNTPFSSSHPGGANFAFADGHVSVISEDVDDFTYQEAASMNSGGVLDLNSL